MCRKFKNGWNCLTDTMLGLFTEFRIGFVVAIQIRPPIRTPFGRCDLIHLEGNYPQASFVHCRRRIGRQFMVPIEPYRIAEPAREQLRVCSLALNVMSSRTAALFRCRRRSWRRCLDKRSRRVPSLTFASNAGQDGANLIAPFPAGHLYGRIGHQRKECGTRVFARRHIKSACREITAGIVQTIYEGLDAVGSRFRLDLP